ncbi:MAG: hypothetical protein K9N55_18920 [Phycisphaerae bacterium]|nr:hypothetical protein [Phycisphaerae bacterium]
MRAFNKIVSVCLVCAGVACVVFGTCFHSVDVSADESGASLTMARSELALTQEASVGGAKLDPNTGQIKQTYTGESPKACAT